MKQGEIFWGFTTNLSDFLSDKFIREGEVSDIMSDIKKKSKKMDIRVEQNLYDEIILLSWFSNQKRSEFLRSMIAYFRETAIIKVDNQEFSWEEALTYAEQQMNDQSLSIDDFSQTRAYKEDEIAIELKEDLERFADVYARQALDAYKKHTGKG